MDRDRLTFTLASVAEHGDSKEVVGDAAEKEHQEQVEEGEVKVGEEEREITRGDTGSPKTAALPSPISLSRSKRARRSPSDVQERENEKVDGMGKR